MKLVILDRDGVINQDRDDFVKSADEWVPLPRSADAIAFLNQFGFTVVVASNQSGLSRAYFTMTELNDMHDKMHRVVQQAGGEIAGIWFCPHQAEAECQCRKPETALIEDILERFGASASETYLVGDSLRDLLCIDKVGGIPILVLTGKGKKTLSQEEEFLPSSTQVFEDLWSFAQFICTTP